MKLLGNRVLVSKVEEPRVDGFQSVSVQDSFIYKGKVEQGKFMWLDAQVKPGDIIIFAKYSPDTHEIDVDGKKMKAVATDDIIAVL